MVAADRIWSNLTHPHNPILARLCSILPLSSVCDTWHGSIQLVIGYPPGLSQCSTAALLLLLLLLPPILLPRQLSRSSELRPMYADSHVGRSLGNREPIKCLSTWLLAPCLTHSPTTGLGSHSHPEADVQKECFHWI
ncbi:hypothetical protein LZ31DRAFT_294273 [Colletotrichum somersetense]|nr:hypothetical protein LZ31DRAFT_294273 [Colletotrichum somersetense]